MSIQGGTLADRLRRPVLTLRILVAAMALGSVTFAGVAILVHGLGPPVPVDPAARWLTLIGIGAVPIALAASRILPALITNRARTSIARGQFELGPDAPTWLPADMGDAGKLCAVNQTRSIAGAALLEGAAMFNAAACFIGGSPISLGMAVGLAALILIHFFPSPQGLADWIEEQQRLIADEKLLVR